MLSPDSEKWNWKFWTSVLSGNRLRILMFHSISRNPSDPHALAPDHFLQIIESLAGFEVVSLEDGIQRLGASKQLRKVVALTFDDAYEDFLVHALPILERHQYPATVFVPTGHLGGTAKWDSFDKTKRLMQWDDLVEIRKRNIAIASHSVNHMLLTECNECELEYELCASLNLLRERIGHVFPALSYPGGSYGTRECEAARKAGYICAVGVSSRWGNGPETDLYRLRRQIWS